MRHQTFHFTVLTLSVFLFGIRDHLTLPPTTSFVFPFTCLLLQVYEFTRLSVHEFFSLLTSILTIQLSVRVISGTVLPAGIVRAYLVLPQSYPAMRFPFHIIQVRGMKHLESISPIEIQWLIYIRKHNTQHVSALSTKLQEAL